jgi:hypothetical protein
MHMYAILVEEWINIDVFGDGWWILYIRKVRISNIPIIFQKDPPPLNAVNYL